MCDLWYILDNAFIVKLSNIVKNYGCPPGSCVIPTPTAYMTDEVWLKILPKLLKGIRQMEGIRDYPKFKAMLSFDGWVQTKCSLCLPWLLPYLYT